MSASQHHIIHSLKYEVFFEGNCPNDQQNALSRIHFEKIQELLQRFFDSFSEKDRYVRINALELDLGIISSRNWQSNFAGQLEKVLYDKLERGLLNQTDIRQFSADEKDEGPADISLLTEEERSEDALLFFLQKGYLSWIHGESDSWTINGNFENILNRRSENFEQRLLYLLKQSEVSLKRFVEQVEPRLQIKWLEYFYPGAVILSDEIFAFEKQMRSYPEISGNLVNKICLWLQERLISYVLNHDREPFNTDSFLEKHSGEFLKVFYRDLINTGKSGSLKPSEDRENLISQFIITSLSAIEKDPRLLVTAVGKDSDLISGEDMKHEIKIRETDDFYRGLFAENSGLVLLWPYMHTLFSRFLLLKDHQFRGVEEKTQALFMLHYLATGSLNAEEHQLLVPKILIAYDLELAVPSYSAFDDTIREECDRVLSAVIKHWAALKSTSTGGLRQTFLQRRALIKLKEDGWHFMFERKGVDVLIDRLPYGLSVIKLEWLEQPFYVSW